ncbi:MAG: cell division protein FtsZ [Chloroflexota bacterium]|jgi:cell division protein FtsZ|nr:cell division protein FtsZ [Chloroflexota bacterium]
MVVLEPLAADELRPRIIVIGVGGAGGNAVANLIAGDITGVEFVVANTDAQALATAFPAHPIQLGAGITGGFGAGSAATAGKAAAEESIETISLALDGCHMCFIAAGMGGGTGTGAAPIIARAARDKGILTVGVVTMPFSFEGTRRGRAAEAGIETLRQHVDTLIVIPNQNLFRIASPDTTFKEAFLMADEVLRQGVRGITDLMVLPGLINLDFADIRSVMGGMGQAMMGTGEASGDNRAMHAVEMAISNPLLDGALKGASGLLISIVGGEDMGLMEIDEAANYIKELIDPEADIIWGSAIDPLMQGSMRVSIVATGLDVATEASRARQFIRATIPAEILLSEADAKRADLTLSSPAAQGMIDLESALGDLFADDNAASAANAELDEALLLSSHDTRPKIISAAIAHAANGTTERCETPQPHGPTLFERVAAMTRRGGKLSLNSSFPPAPDRVEFPGVYNRRLPQNYSNRPQS